MKNSKFHTTLDIFKEIVHTKIDRGKSTFARTYTMLGKIPLELDGNHSPSNRQK